MDRQAYWTERRAWQTWLTRRWQPETGSKATLYFFTMSLFENETYTTGEIKVSQMDLAWQMSMSLRTVEDLWPKVVGEGKLFTVVREESSGRKRPDGRGAKPLKVLRRCAIPEEPDKVAGFTNPQPKDEPAELACRVSRVIDVEGSRKASSKSRRVKKKNPQSPAGSPQRPDVFESASTLTASTLIDSNGSAGTNGHGSLRAMKPVEVEVYRTLKIDDSDSEEPEFSDCGNLKHPCEDCDCCDEHYRHIRSTPSLHFRLQVYPKCRWCQVLSRL